MLMKRKAESVDESKVYFVGVGESSSPDELAAAEPRTFHSSHSFLIPNVRAEPQRPRCRL